MAARIGKKRIREAIAEHGGVIAKIAKQFEVSRQTVYNWISKYQLQGEIDAAREEVFTVAVDNLASAVLGGNLDISKFWVTHMPTRKHTKWGTSTATEHSTADGEPMPIQVLFKQPERDGEDD